MTGADVVPGPRTGLPVTLSAALPALLSLAVAITLAAVLAVSHGGYAPTSWYPAALTSLAALVLSILLAPPGPHERSRAVERAIVLYGLFCAWSYLSILWAAVPGQAWDAANRDLFYGVVFALVALRRWPAPLMRVALAGTVLTVTGVAVGTLVASTHGDVSRLFLEGRLSEPFGYSNATPCFWLIAVWPALWLAIDRRMPWWARAVALGCAGLLLETALLSQSRGAAFAAGVTAVLLVVFIPRRMAALTALIACAVAVAASWHQLTHVRDVRRAGDLAGAMVDARRSIVVSALALLLAGGLLALLDRRFGPGLEERARPLARLRKPAWGAVGILAVAAVLVIIGNPGSWLHARYEDFKGSGYTQVERASNRFASGSLGSNRYDFYRVALNEFRAPSRRGHRSRQFRGPLPPASP